MSTSQNGIALINGRPVPSFIEYRSAYQHFCRGNAGVRLPLDVFYERLVPKVGKPPLGEPPPGEPLFVAAEALRSLAELQWHMHDQPQLRIYGHYVNLFRHTTLDIPVCYCRMPLPAIAVCCEHASPFSNALVYFVEHPLHQLLLSINSYGDDGLTVACDVEPHKTIQECMDDAVRFGFRDADFEGVQSVMRIALNAILMLGHSHDSGIVHPIVLTDHIERYRQAADAEKEHLVAKARKKHRVGWTIGHPQLLPRRTVQQAAQEDALDKHTRERNHQYIRCGHWKEQAYGHRWSQHRVIWIPPTICRPDLPPSTCPKRYVVR